MEIKGWKIFVNEYILPVYHDLPHNLLMYRTQEIKEKKYYPQLLSGRAFILRCISTLLNLILNFDVNVSTKFKSSDVEPVKNDIVA